MGCSRVKFTPFFYHAATAVVGQGLLIVENSWLLSVGHTTMSRTPLDVRSAQSRNLYLTTHNTPNRENSTPPAGFEPAIPASERPQTHALDCADTGIGENYRLVYLKYSVFIKTVRDVTMCADERQRPTQPTDPSSPGRERVIALSDPPTQWLNWYLLEKLIFSQPVKKVAKF